MARYINVRCYGSIRSNMISKDSSFISRSRTVTSNGSSRVTPIIIVAQNNLSRIVMNRSLFNSISMTNGRFMSSSNSGIIQEKGVIDSPKHIKFKTLHELQVNGTAEFSHRPLFGTYKENTNGLDGNFEWTTFKDYADQVEACRMILKDSGVGEYSKVGIISNNRSEWASLASATYSLNATFVPMYEAQLPCDWSYILNDSGCTALFCATKDIYDRCMKEVIPKTPSVKSVLCLDAEEGEEHAFSTHMNISMQLIKQGKQDPLSSIIAPQPDDLANLIYTSGTTGKPKGVELTHSNTVSNVKGVRNSVKDINEIISKDDCSLAFLPWAHSYGQTTELWMSIAHGSRMGICRGIPFLLEDLKLVQPSLLYAVPTLYKKIYDGVHNLIENSSPLRKHLMKRALQLGRKNTESRKIGERMSFVDNIHFQLLDKIVLSKIRARFGGKLRHGFVAGAACPSEVLNFMDDVGIKICEGYGLTETSPIITLNTPLSRNPGFVGKPLPGVKVIIIAENGAPAPDGKEGEICCSGPNVMRGYYKNSKATDEVISLAPDGISRIFHTGDLGCMTADGWVKITGRIKEQYKLENGKYVCPTPIEEAISMSRFVLQCVLFGANRPYNVCLIVPDWNSICSELNINEELEEDELVSNQDVKALIDIEIEKNCSKIKKFEVPKDWAFVSPFTAANNMLTPKMSIRRHIVVREHADAIDNMYSSTVVHSACDGKIEEVYVA